MTVYKTDVLMNRKQKELTENTHYKGTTVRAAVDSLFSLLLQDRCQDKADQPGCGSTGAHPLDPENTRMLKILSTHEQGFPRMHSFPQNARIQYRACTCTSQSCASLNSTRDQQKPLEKGCRCSCKGSSEAGMFHATLETFPVRMVWPLFAVSQPQVISKGAGAESPSVLGDPVPSCLILLPPIL